MNPLRPHYLRLVNFSPCLLLSNFLIHHSRLFVIFRKEANSAQRWVAKWWHCSVWSYWSRPIPLGPHSNEPLAALTASKFWLIYYSKRYLISLDILIKSRKYYWHLESSPSHPLVEACRQSAPLTIKHWRSWLLYEAPCEFIFIFILHMIIRFE